MADVRRMDGGTLLIRTALAALLLGASVAKGYQIVAETPIATVHLPAWTVVALVSAEFTLGLWILFRLYERPTSYLVIGCFVVFASVALMKAVSGDSDCGCFGKFHLNPWISFAVDVFAIAIGACWTRRVRQQAPVPAVRPRIAIFLAVLAIFGIPAAEMMLPEIVTGREAQDDPIGAAQIVRLEPQNWIGKQFPLAPYVDVGTQLMSGEWTVLLYYDGCDTCKRVLPHYRELEHQLRARGDKGHVALVRMPPFDESAAPTTESKWTSGRITLTTKQWRAPAPVELILSDGIVASTRIRVDYPSRLSKTSAAR